MAAAELGATYSAGTGIWTVTGASVAGDAITLELTDLLSTTVATKTVAPPFAPCSLLDWQDGLELGWTVGGALILTAALLLMTRATKVQP